MTALLITFLLFLLPFSDALPFYKTELDRVIADSPCLSTCMRRIEATQLDLSITKTHDYGRYLQNVDNVCRYIDEARSCVNTCNVTSNPFSLRFMTVMCNPEVLKEVEEYRPCFEKAGDRVLNECTAHCGDLDAVNENIARLSLGLQRHENNPQLTSDLMAKTNIACGMTKCFARCSRTLYSVYCQNTVQGNAGDFLAKFIEESLAAMQLDLNEQQVEETMKTSMPEQCNYLHMPNVMFNSSNDRLAIDRLIQQRNRNYPSTTLNTKMNVDDLQKQLIMLQIRVLQKTERNLDKESRKLDLELEKDRRIQRLTQ